MTLRSARFLVLVLLTATLISHTEARAIEAGATTVSSDLFPAAVRALQFPGTTLDLERPDYSSDLAITGAQGRSFTLASPPAAKARFIAPSLEAPRAASLAPAHAADAWLMVLVSALLVAHQLRRKQRSLNHRFTR